MNSDRQTTAIAPEIHGQDFRAEMLAAAAAVPGFIYSFRIRPDGTMSMPFASPAITDIFGGSSDQVVADLTGTSVLLHPDDVERTRASISDSARTLMPWHQEFRVRHPHKGELWIDANSIPHREADGAILWHGYMQDITTRKADEEALHYKNEVLSAQQEASLDGILVVNTDFSIASMNSRFAEMWGLPKELIDRKDHKAILEFSTPLFANPESFAEGVKTLYLDPAGRSLDELPLKDGRIVERHSAPLFGSDGRSCGRLWTFRDITEARKIQEALREAEQFARSTSDSLSAHISILDADGVILSTNRSWRRFADRNHASRNVLEGANYLSICDTAVGPEQEQAESFAKGVREVLAGVKEEFSLEYPCHSPTEKRWFVGRVTRMVGDGPTRLAVAHEDITDRVLALNALRHSKALLSEMEQTAKIGGWDMDVTTGITTWTDEVARIHAVEIDAPMSVERALAFYVGESRMAITEALTAAATEAKPFDLEVEFEAADGVRKWIRVIGRPEMSNDLIARVTGSFQDITDKKKIEMALKESETLFSTVFRVTPIAINIFRLADGRSILVNEGYTGLTGFSREEVIGHTAADIHLFPDPKARGPLLKDLSVRESTIMTDARIQTKTGEIRDTLVSLNAFSLNGEPVAIVVATDVTDRKRAEVELKALQEQLVHAQKMESIGRLAGGVAHDFNNLLQLINAYSKRIADDYAQDPQLQRYGKSIHQAGEIAANLTRQLLAFSRKAPAKPRKLELDTVLAGVKDMIQGLLGDQVPVEMDLNAPQRFIVVDPSQIEQIVMNLTVNARDAMPSGGVLTVSTSLTYTGDTSTQDNSDRPTSVVLSISDTGHGMDPETQARVFEPFFTTKELGRGTGLGLAMVYGIVQQSGGTIEIDSRLGKGTVFRLSFPLVEDAKSNAGPTPIKTVPRGSERILLVEDDPDLRQLYEDVLSDLGYIVSTAANGREAIDFIENAKGAPALVISDNTMPIMGGIELFELLRETKPALSLLLMSGNAGERAEHPEAIRHVELLEKPFSMADFAAKVRQILDQRTPDA